MSKSDASSMVQLPGTAMTTRARDAVTLCHPAGTTAEGLATGVAACLGNDVAAWLGGAAADEPQAQTVQLLRRTMAARAAARFMA
ncbi:hypothetical protein Back2_13010 [Nocardioides baekrokdamisoli]|uniref:Uncharacterized protein n=1 Tax=Nocardioides baekrokdamisoli TaxID=1804624 RepID=A0A3G9J0M0_9ACTN|nr:hypothetical protein Back2_13010 [Nocardioides baekrokdamisoli]